MLLSRRLFLSGLVAAPVVVGSGVLMPLRGIVMSSEVFCYPLTLEEYVERIMRPMVDNLQRQIAESIFSRTDSGISVLLGAA